MRVRRASDSVWTVTVNGRPSNERQRTVRNDSFLKIYHNIFFVVEYFWGLIWPNKKHIFLAKKSYFAM
jgi:hypothetical protein